MDVKIGKMNHDIWLQIWRCLACGEVSAFFNMATCRPKCIQRGLLCGLIYLFIFTFDVQTVSENVKWLKNISSGRLQLRNLEKDDKIHTGVSDDGYFPDARQEPPDPSVLGGIRIEHEAQKLSARLRWLSNEEIGITKMQVMVLIISKILRNVIFLKIMRVFKAQHPINDTSCR